MGSVKKPEDAKESGAKPEVSTRSNYQLEDADHLSVSSRQRIRDQMNADIETFLARGGKIEKLDITMSAEKLAQQQSQQSS